MKLPGRLPAEAASKYSRSNNPKMSPAADSLQEQRARHLYDNHKLEAVVAPRNYTKYLPRQYVDGQERIML